MGGCERDAGGGGAARAGIVRVVGKAGPAPVAGGVVEKEEKRGDRPDSRPAKFLIRRRRPGRERSRGEAQFFVSDQSSTIAQLLALATDQRPTSAWPLVMLIFEMVTFVQLPIALLRA